MSKKIRTIIFILATVIIAVIAVLFFSLNVIVKQGIEKIGPSLTKTSISLEKSKISLFSGTGKLEGLIVGNPEGYATPASFTLQNISVTVKPLSIFSDRIIVDEIVIDAPRITYEMSSSGSNISTIYKNIRSFSTSSGDKKQREPGKQEKGKNLQINNLIVKNGAVTMSMVMLKGENITASLPDIHLKDIGAGKEGKSISEAVEEVFKVANTDIADAVSVSVKDISKQTGEEVKKTIDTLKGLLNN